MVSPSKFSDNSRRNVQEISQKVVQKFLADLIPVRKFQGDTRISSTALVRERSIFKYQNELKQERRLDRNSSLGFLSFSTFKRKQAVVPLTWAAKGANNSFVNLGDALSPVMVSALSGLPIVHQNFDTNSERLACVGTIGHALKNGTVHLWGTGMDSIKVNKRKVTTFVYRRPSDTEIRVHALRGKLTAAALEGQGVKTTHIYGDPVWFLPSIMKPATEKRYELGIIVHLSELKALTDESTVHDEFLRYHIPESLRDRVRIITTMVKPTIEAMEQKIKEITSCKRIATTSLHGLVIAETYDIPCVFFQFHGATGPTFIPLMDESYRLDRRIRDFYSGVNVEELFVYAQPRSEETNWDDLIHAIDRYWKPIDWSADAFLESFPLPLAFDPRKQRFNNHELLKKIRF